MLSKHAQVALCTVFAGALFIAGALLGYYAPVRNAAHLVGKITFVAGFVLLGAGMLQWGYNIAVGKKNGKDGEDRNRQE